MLNIVLFGAPGAGKGTQAAKLAAKYNINHIATGEVIRDEIRRGTDMGKSVQEYISRGELVPDQLVIGMITEYVKSHRGCAGNIFDGFPRTTPQAEAFDEIMQANDLKVDVMLELAVPEEELVQRLLLRGRDSGRADDADEGVIRNRISVYNAQTAVVADFYRKQNKYVSIDGQGTIDEIFERISSEIERMK